MQYDSPVSAADFQDFLTTANFSDDTAAAISSLLNLDAGDSVNVASFDGVNAELPTSGNVDVVTGVIEGAEGDQVTLNLPESFNTAKAFILQSDANLVATFDAPVASEEAPAAATFAAAARIAVPADASAEVEFVVTTGNGDDVITVNGDQNTFIDAGDGNDTIVTGNGNNTVIAGEGNNNVKTGSGNDTVVLSGSNHADIVDTGAGYDVVQLDGSRDDYEFAVGNNFNVNLTGNQTASITNAEFLTFVEGDTVETVALAHSEAEAAALRLYEGILGRDADLAGAKSFVELVNNGTSQTDIANQFLNSAEFAGANNEASINSLYSALLGRTGDEAGVDAWEAVLANGGTLTDVAAGIALSQEAVTLDQSNGTFVEELYESVLGREADEDGLNAWVTQLFSGTSRAEVAQGIIESAEAGAKANSDFIDSLYQSALGREADDAGKAGWTQVLENGGTQADVAIGIVGSQEAVANIDNVVVLHGNV
ncbi:DUF4214 domain-containing protein [Pseudomonas capeferrum]|uniref:DUF4214 domain-containing protein n=1 Tax=Pseudomonas capeferrum TaxID=1495066 RepID=UPI0015E37B44|nr:DUF4214 domain-containing protein [Pseudomonas capeferrum]MBA1204429.1 DUF4214 domain-containing protein [Pseudomonas capeferrum]